MVWPIIVLVALSKFLLSAHASGGCGGLTPTGGGGQDVPIGQPPTKEKKVSPFTEFQNLLGPSGPTLTWPAQVSGNRAAKQSMFQVVGTAKNFIGEFGHRQDSAVASVGDAAIWAQENQGNTFYSFATNFEIYIAIDTMRKLKLEQRVALELLSKGSKTSNDEAYSTFRPSYETDPVLVDKILDDLGKRMQEDGLMKFGKPMQMASTFNFDKTQINEALQGMQLGFSTQNNFVYHYLKHGFDTAMKEGTMSWDTFRDYLDGTEGGVGPFQYISEANDFIRHFPVEQLRFAPEDPKLWSKKGVKITVESEDKKAVITLSFQKEIWLATYFIKS